MIIATLAASLPAGAETRADSLLEVLDGKLADRSMFLQVKRARLDSLHRIEGKASTDDELVSCLFSQFEEYKTFALDTAIMIARRCYRINKRSANDSLLWRSSIMEAEALQAVARYRDALSILDALPSQARSMFNEEMFKCYVKVYYSLFNDTYPRNDAERYRIKLIEYRDSLVTILPSETAEYHINKAEMLRVLGSPRSSMDEVDILLSYYLTDTEHLSRVLYVAHNVALMNGQRQRAKELLIQAAIADIESCSRNYESLPMLAMMLYEEADYNRAYTYITTSMHDIERSNARSRVQKITEMLPFITEAHRDNIARRNRTQNVLIVVISLLSVCLIVSLLFAYRRNKILVRERQSLAERNDELTALQSQLAEANERLADSAKVKEEYIGYLFSLCSEYIETHERERTRLANKIKTGKIHEVEMALRSSQSTENLNSFYAKFDSIFLGLFPDFIDKMNSLLTDDYKLAPRDSERLSPELRIYALVRLGINDSSKIANFLHYSTQTVYNYRFRVRSHARVPKEDFVRHVQQLD